MSSKEIVDIVVMGIFILSALVSQYIVMSNELTKHEIKYDPNVKETSD